MQPIVNGLEKDYAGRVTFRAHEWRAATSRALIEQYGLTETPTFVILDATGRARVMVTGELTREDLRARIDTVLQE